MHSSLMAIFRVLFNPLTPFDYLKANKFSGQSQAWIQKRAAASTFRHRYVIEFAILFTKILLKILYDEPFESYFFLLFFRIFVKIS
jgi:hypothetical protein